MSQPSHRARFECQQQMKLKSSVGALLTSMTGLMELGLLWCWSPLVSAAEIASNSQLLGEGIPPAHGTCGIVHAAFPSLAFHRTSLPTSYLSPSLLLPQTLFPPLFPECHLCLGDIERTMRI